MVIALLCLVLSFLPEDQASSMIERGLAQKDEQQADRLEAGQEGWFYSQQRCVCVGKTEAIFQLKRQWSTF